MLLLPTWTNGSSSSATKHQHARTPQPLAPWPTTLFLAVCVLPIQVMAAAIQGQTSCSSDWATPITKITSSTTWNQPTLMPTGMVGMPAQTQLPEVQVSTTRLAISKRFLRLQAIPFLPNGAVQRVHIGASTGRPTLTGTALRKVAPLALHSLTAQQAISSARSLAAHLIAPRRMRLTNTARCLSTGRPTEPPPKNNSSHG